MAGILKLCKKGEVREMPRKKAEHLKGYDFEPIVEGKPLRRVPVSVKLPEELDDYVRSQPNRNQWLIAVIARAVAEEKITNQ